MKSSHGLTLWDVDTWHEDPACYIQHNTALFNAVRCVSGCRYIVDSSKNMHRFEALNASGVFDLRAVNLMRRAPGRVHSLMKDRDDWIVRKTDGWVKLARAHRKRMMRVREIMSGLDDYHRVRYEQLATAPRETVCGIMNWLGLEFEESQLDWTAHKHHNLGGNRMRRERKKEIVLDDSWKRRLSPLQITGIALITWPAHLPGKRTYRLVGPVSRIRSRLRKAARRYGYWPTVRLAWRLARMFGYRS